MVKPDFENLVERHSAEIFAYVWRMLRDAVDAEDCLQETFLRAFRSYGRVRAGTNYRAWLYKIATNAARSQWKRRTRREAHTTELDPDRQANEVSTADRVEQQVLLAAVARAVEELPAQQRAALIMRKYQELSYADIATALDCTEAAARANVYQAVKKLQARLGVNE
ncbi:RNA polymerase sigma-H factor [Thermoflexales bacterium]|nr:RNA polymerase sigma-H factor [Thermoflexales bacterium]